MMKSEFNPCFLPTFSVVFPDIKSGKWKYRKQTNLEGPVYMLFFRFNRNEERLFIRAAFFPEGDWQMKQILRTFACNL